MVGRWLWVLVFAVFCSLARAADVPTTPAVIHLASEDWDDYTAADGHGLAWDILRAVFEPSGVKLDIRTVPYTRSVGLVQRREVDALVGSYSNEADQVLYPRWNFDSDHIYALGLASNPVPTLETLGAYRLAWVRGYRYESYLPNIHRYNQIERRTGILPMLKQARADFYIDALTEINEVLAEAEDPSLYRRTHLTELPLYLGFADTPRARALMALYDQRMVLLVKSGQLKPIFEHWKQPYPFDESAKPAGQ
ncbi:ABC transporter substrate-binding protein [Pseudomonas sp. FW306-02-F02-AA]|uniref:ABC transporter substrate-binding protein n=1 Tax=Pseudomonas fluorescens TaxID=294 RepID=A0A0N9W9F6_PSEFL|nr:MULTISPECIES: transporter substrate-binding domain-containing protein [Pseudomonas]ALI00751.1 ABC transporter substrate-binding protein [Pseudomonas fluorescens]PMZ04464.1 ABC transporter substrate-binding protein [Pseudomonas sp. FW306-02-F02-AB]PMZ07962.1 ABC transporter substrate-binding protein [Pseudomonas sp. FW306-02-H06C]PMZ16191.1 ABC transporter substrate-binding protein [Pseudomonas sp. FW306-02-F02-AA]PMZ22132.1 ABC transporter substrate-binding protein [Pseudomonas sp. FW306-02